MMQIPHRAATEEELADMEKTHPICAGMYHYGERGHLGCGGGVRYDGTPGRYWYPGSSYLNYLPEWAEEARRNGTLVILCHPNLTAAVEEYHRREAERKRG